MKRYKTYFKDVQTLDELRKQYRDLLKKYHPDNENGSVEITQEINAEYERLFKILKDKHTRQQNNGTEGTKGSKSDNSTSYDNMKYDFKEDELLREMLQKVIYFSDITIEIIGNWIWLSGNTYQYRKESHEPPALLVVCCWPYWADITFPPKGGPANRYLVTGSRLKAALCYFSESPSIRSLSYCSLMYFLMVSSFTFPTVSQ